LAPSTIGIYWFREMPILPPEPGKILDELRAVEARLRELAARPGDVLVEVALGSVAVAVMALAAHVSPPSAAS
jgi:hypothetical protein